MESFIKYGYCLRTLPLTAKIEMCIPKVLFLSCYKNILILRNQKNYKKNTFDYCGLLDTGAIFLNDNKEPYKIDKREGNKSHARGIMSQPARRKPSLKSSITLGIRPVSIKSR
jgi:hypothetical protein